MAVRPSAWPLTLRLLLWQTALLLLLVGGLWVLLERQQRAMTDHLRDYSQDLTGAVEISVQQFNQEAPDDKSLTSAARDRLKKKGIREISLLESDKSLLATTDPKRRGRPFVIEERIGPAGAGSEPVLIPLLVDGKPVGYIHLVLALDDFTALERRLALQRALWIAGVVLLGMLGGYLALRRALGPVASLADAAQRVAAGDLTSDLPEPARADETGRLVAAFNRMLAALRQGRAAESKLRDVERQALVGALGAEVAHELRNPINYLSLSIDHLVSQLRPAQAEAAAELDAQHARIKDEIQRLSRLAGDFMTLARPAVPRAEPVALAPLVRDAAAVLAGPLAERGVRLELEVPAELTVRADPDRLRAALGNLLHNAVMFSPAGGLVTVSGRLDETGAGLIRVRDRGPGIPEADLQKIFEPFFTTRPGGTGLGLAIVRRVAEEHGGSVSASAAEGGGLEFTLRLPGAADAGRA